MDMMLQLSCLTKKKRALYLPTRITYMRIDPKLHVANTEKFNNEMPTSSLMGLGYCTSGGVEIQGLKCSIAPRRRGQISAAVLESYSFVPNFEVDLVTEEEESIIEEYTEVCSAVARRILEASGKNKAQISEVMNGFKEASEDIIRKYLDSSSDNRTLLSILKTILNTTEVGNDLKENVMKVLNENEHNLGKDILFTAILKERCIRPALDLVIENTPSRKLNIVEMSSKYRMSDQILNLMRTTNVLLQANYIIANTEELSKNEKLPEEIKHLKWDINSSTAGPTDMDLVIAKDTVYYGKSPRATLQALSQLIKDDAFILLIERTQITPAEMFLAVVTEQSLSDRKEENIEKACIDLGLEIVSKKSDSMTASLYLLRKSGIRESDSSAVVHISSDSFEWVEDLKTAVKEFQDKPAGQNIWLISEQDPRSGILGTINCLRQEPGGHKIRCIFDTRLQVKTPFDPTSELFEDLVRKNLTINVLKNGQWGSYRHSNIPKAQLHDTVETNHAYLNVLTRGDLSSLRWVQSPLNYWSENQDSFRTGTMCHIYCSPLNFRDIMLAIGKLPPDAIPGDLATADCLLGLEFSGRDERGNRVMGLVPTMGMATSVIVDPNFLWKVPKDWTLEQASTVPVAYSTAYYALVVRGSLCPGETVLIHSGSGGVGQASISIALSMGCKVFTTVGSVEKRKYLMERFPELKEENFSNSRDSSFEMDIMAFTNGRGVDVVLNSLAEEKLQASVRCLALHGRFLEIGKYDLSSDNPLGMSAFLKNITFHGILLDSLFGDDVNIGTKKRVVSLVNEGILSGAVRPLDFSVYDKTKVEEAFRFMASGKHIGKVILKVREEESDSVIVPLPNKVLALPRLYCYPKKCYIIAGGLGGFGLELAGRLVERGAKNLILTSRNGATTGYQLASLERWKKNGVNVIVSSEDIATEKSAFRLLQESNKLGPVGGIFNLAMVLADSLLENLTAEDFTKVCVPKVNGTLNLDKASRSLCPELQWFVVFSSVSCGRGNAGQSNYGYANSVMERVCEQRQKDGLPGLAIQWGAIGDVGVVQEMMGGNDVVIGGTVPQRIQSCLQTLELFIQQRYPVVSCYVPAEITKGKNSGKGAGVLQMLAKILGLPDASTLNPDTTLGELGMDSLMGVEVKQTLERDFDVVLSMQEIRHVSIKQLQELENSGTFVSTSTKSDVAAGIMSDVQVQRPGVKRTRSLTENPFKLPVMVPSFMPVDTLVTLNDSPIGAEQPLFMVHPIEGFVVAFHSTADHLDRRTYGLQCTYNAPLNRIEDLATFYIKKIREVQPEGPYNLCGYSFGAVVAFEMALQLQTESNSCNGDSPISSLILMEGSPKFLAAHTEKFKMRFRDKYQESEVQVMALITIMLWFMDFDPVGVRNELIGLATWEAQKRTVIKKISEVTGHEYDAQDLENAVFSFSRKLLVCDKYRPKKLYDGEITLIKAKQNRVLTGHLSKDYGLKEMCSGEVKVETVDGTHETFLQTSNAAKVAELLKIVSLSNIAQ